MAKSSHRDEAVTHLRALYKQIENEIRMLQREQAQVAKALGMFVQEDGSISVARTTPRVLGPRRYDTDKLVLQNIVVHRAPGKDFTTGEATEWSPELRKGQINSALDKLVKGGKIIRNRKGVFMLPPKENNGNNAS